MRDGRGRNSHVGLLTRFHRQNHLRVLEILSKYALLYIFCSTWTDDGFFFFFGLIKTDSSDLLCVSLKPSDSSCCSSWCQWRCFTPDLHVYSNQHMLFVLLSLEGGGETNKNKTSCLLFYFVPSCPVGSITHTATNLGEMVCSEDGTDINSIKIRRWTY